MEIVATVARWAFITAGVSVVIAADFSSAVVGIVAIYATAENLLRRISRKRMMLPVRPPVIPRPSVGPAARKR